MEFDRLFSTIPPHHLANFMTSMINNTKLQECVAAFRKGVPTEELNLQQQLSLVDAFLDSDHGENLLGLIAGMKEAVGQELDPFPISPTDFDCAEVCPDKNPVTSGPAIESSDPEEIREFIADNADLGVVSRNVIQNVPECVDWEVSDQYHLYVCHGSGINPDHPAGIWPQPVAVPRAPVQLSLGKHALGISFLKEFIEIELEPMVLGGKDLGGRNLPVDHLFRNARQCKRVGWFCPEFVAQPEKLSLKIDGEYCYMVRRRNEPGYLQFRNGDRFTVSPGPPAKLALEYVAGHGFVLLRVDRWKFPNPVGWEFDEHFLQSKAISFRCSDPRYAGPLLSSQHHGLPTDGVVAHVGRNQYFFKVRHTLDLDFQTYEWVMKSYPVTADPIPESGIHEFELHRDRLTYVRARRDKLKPNKISSIAATMTCPTLIDKSEDWDVGIPGYDLLARFHEE